MIYDNFLELCSSVGKSPSAVAVELGFSKATVSHWKHQRNEVSAAAALKIANYFGTTVDELKNGIKKPPTETDERSDAIAELNALYASLSDENKQLVLALAKSLQGK